MSTVFLPLNKATPRGITGVYKILNSDRQEVYIGSSSDVKRRFIEHNTMLINGYHNRKELQDIYNEAEQDFLYIYKEIKDRDEAYDEEQRILNELHGTEYLCNVAKDARLPNLGLTASKETREKMSISHIGNTYSLGYKHSEETKAIMSESKKGNKNMLGKTLTDEWKAKIRQGNLGKTVSDETKQKQREANKARMVKVVTENNEYESVNAAAIALDVDRVTIQRRCRSGLYTCIAPGE